MGRAPQISREAVLAAALRLADEQGLDAVTMEQPAAINDLLTGFLQETSWIR